MRTSTKYLTMLGSAILVLGGFSSQAAAQALFSDDFEDRVKDQADIGNGWTWYLLTFGGDTCTGDTIFEWGPWSDGDGSDLPAANRNYWTASSDVGQGDSYYRAGLEIPAWEGALTNMLRVYGDQYLTYASSCERVLIFQEMSIANAGSFTFSFDVAEAQFGAPANGEITGAFVKILQANEPWATLWTQSIITTPPTPPALATQSIDFNVPAEYVGELLQFGFYNDVTEDLGQSWANAAATYDNVLVAPTVVEPPPPYIPGDLQGVPIPFWALFGIGGLLAYFGASKLRSRKKT
jgi:hypothetical protein